MHKVEIIKGQLANIAIVTGDGAFISNERDAIDLAMDISYNYEASRIIIYKEALSEDFFDLSTTLAGNILQKYVNYEIKLAIVGDFSVYASKSLRDFIYESNKIGKHVYFAGDIDEAIRALDK